MKYRICSILLAPCNSLASTSVAVSHSISQYSIISPQGCTDLDHYLTNDFKMGFITRFSFKHRLNINSGVSDSATCLAFVDFVIFCDYARDHRDVSAELILCFNTDCFCSIPAARESLRDQNERTGNATFLYSPKHFHVHYVYPSPVINHFSSCRVFVVVIFFS